MAWKFPRRKPRDGQVMDHIDFDEGIRPFIDELGHLEDHNFDRDMKSQLVEGHLDDEVHRRIAVASVQVDDDIRVSPAGLFSTNKKDTWVPIDGLLLEFTSFGGILALSASMQARRPNDNQGQQLLNSNLYCQWGFEVDGAVVTESVIGDQDVLYEGLSMETGTEGMVYPVHLEAVIPITPGAHTVRVVVRALEGPPRYATNPDNVNNASDQYPYGRIRVGSRELVAIEDA